MQASEAQRDLLRDLPARVAVDRIDRVWIFQPREAGGRESGLVVLSLLPAPGGDADRREVLTWRYEAERERGRTRRTDALVEQGRAPADRVPRVIDGVLARLGDGAENPVTATIGGSAERWRALLESLGVTPVDPAGG